MMTWAEFRELQKLVSSDVEPWEQNGSCIYAPGIKLVAQCKDARTASLITATHNQIAAVCNLVIMLLAKLRDLRKLWSLDSAKAKAETEDK